MNETVLGVVIIVVAILCVAYVWGGIDWLQNWLGSKMRW